MAPCQQRGTEDQPAAGESHTVRAVQHPTSTPLQYDDILSAIMVYSLTTALVLAAVIVAPQLVNGPRKPTFNGTGDQVLKAMAAWDGQWYLSISESGYGDGRDKEPKAAFFPAYPLTVRALQGLTGFPSHVAALVVSHACLLQAMVLFLAYTRQRQRCGIGPSDCRVGLLALWAMALFPTSFFLRAIYSEPSFILLMMWLLYGMSRRWHIGVLALIAGAATATRAVGIVLVAVLAIHVWCSGGARWQRSRRLAWVLPFSCWGIFAYSAFLGFRDGEPLAFVDAHAEWCWRPGFTFMEKVQALLVFEPIWAVYDSESAVYWATRSEGLAWYQSLLFANPFYYVAAAVLIVVGYRKNWLTRDEFVLTCGLWIVPFLTRSFEMGMAGHGRFVAAMPPVFLVLGEALSRMPTSARWAILILFAGLLFAYTVLFAGGYMLV
ncbi:MAG: mannosyltransferase family protein [Planctomycetota bacterium]|nr:mannosyltransferase family protein [Planctomycetota bacterium]